LTVTKQLTSKHPQNLNKIPYKAIAKLYFSVERKRLFWHSTSSMLTHVTQQKTLSNILPVQRIKLKCPFTANFEMANPRNVCHPGALRSAFGLSKSAGMPLQKTTGTLFCCVPAQFDPWI